MATVIKCTGRVSGIREGELLTTRQPFSFWGGVDPASGIINDPRHELFGESIAGKVLAFPCGKGSTGTPLVVLELARVKKAPAGLVQIDVDPLQVAGPLICKHFYGEIIPVVTLSHESFRLLQTGMRVAIDGSKEEIILSSDTGHPTCLQS
jgi:predicted aconitase with swiveling domain